MKAIEVHGKEARLVLNRAVPKPRPDQLLVKVAAVSLNPTDWKHVSRGAASEGCISGCDYAGTVVKIGDQVTKKFKEGDRVAGVAHGANASNVDDGVFAEYAVVKGDLQMRVPDSLSLESASTLALGISTVNQGLFQKALKLNLPTNPSTKNEVILIYGGSTATGSLGIQLAKMAGYRVITTNSPKNNSFVESLGAEKAFDYNSPTVGKDINAYCKDGLKLAWDTIGLDASAKICAEALSSDGAGARYGTILQAQLPRKDIETVSTIMYTIFDEPFDKFGMHFPRMSEDFESAKDFFSMTEKLLAEGKLKPHPVEVRTEGLAGVMAGLKDLQDEKVSGKKLAYNVSETPNEKITKSFA